MTPSGLSWDAAIGAMKLAVRNATGTSSSKAAEQLLREAQRILAGFSPERPEPEGCTCDRDTLLDGMATPGCPVHAPRPEGDVDFIAEAKRLASRDAWGDVDA